MASLYSIGLSGLQSSTARITTTGQNTANVDTEGYSRQTTATVSQSGGGVLIQDTDRIVNQYINQQVWSDTSNYSFYESYQSMMTSFDSVIGEDSVSISDYLDNAFSALQTANSDPTDTAARSNAYSNLKQLAAQYNDLANYISDQKTLANEELESNIDSINNLTDQIANLNQQIYRLETTTSSSANELRDQQEQLVKELSEYLEIKVNYDDNQLMTVNLASGQPLVLQSTNNELRLTSDTNNPDGELGIELDFGNYELNIPTDELGGAVGGLVEFRNEFVTTAERMLGQQALVFADAMNQQNQLGLDANGDYGINLFSTAEIETTANVENSNEDYGIAVRVTDGASSEITTDTYEVEMMSPTTFKLVTYDLDGNVTNESDVIDTTTATPTSDGYFEVDGFGVEIAFDSLPSYAQGDRYQFAPTKNAAESIKMSARSGDYLALASPIAVSRADSNLSDVAISISSITDTDSATSAFSATGGLYNAAPQTLYFTASDEVEIQDGSGTVLATLTGITDYSNLLEQAGLADDAGYDISLDGPPDAGDSFSISFNSDGESDNYNGLKLANLQTENTVEGTRSFTEAFSALVTEVGSLTATLTTNMDASETIMNKSIAARDEVSAVSLDEEAVNLLRYQQSYTASAQVLSAAQSTFATLISALG
ncbi:flagellar hook-associated protein FlgK [Marinomonas ostreistagni]|uniref:Flagellar hook-associated protein 1 n=1 Tax=Marinomonas ostreistagni TaxID=359209 RepID=A0ABS0Z671_9GAMM|nr:flagellar hook-associated protein FlgK [Marinomonas ostreistagni]MBJ7549114.1 flagellar hook-associated protein FlgK [Marinomonas ostreistagni]